jgi:hypothetical protein
MELCWNPLLSVYISKMTWTRWNRQQYRQIRVGYFLDQKVCVHTGGMAHKEGTAKRNSHWGNDYQKEKKKEKKEKIKET